MKRNYIIIVFVIVLIIGIIIGSFIFFNKGNNKEQEQALKIETEQDMKDLINKIYEKVGDQLPNVEIFDVDKTDEWTFSSYTGLSNSDMVETVIVSEPMISSQAYSFVLVKVTDGADVEAMKQEMFDNIDTRKWICVSADKLYVTNYENVICLIMSSEEWADPVYNEFKNAVGGNIGNELIRTVVE